MVPGLTGFPRCSRVSQVPRPIPEATIGLIKKDHAKLRSKRRQLVPARGLFLCLASMRTELLSRMWLVLARRAFSAYSLCGCRIFTPERLSEVGVPPCPEALRVRHRACVLTRMCPSLASAQLRSEANKRAAQAVREASLFAARMGDDMTGPSPSKRPRTEAVDDLLINKVFRIHLFVRTIV